MLKKFFYSFILFFSLILTASINSKAANKFSINSMTVTNDDIYFYIYTTLSSYDDYTIDFELGTISSSGNYSEIGCTTDYEIDNPIIISWKKLDAGNYRFTIYLYDKNKNNISITYIYKNLSYSEDGALVVTDINAEDYMFNVSASERKKINKMLRSYFKAVKKYEISNMNKYFKNVPNKNKYLTNKLYQSFIRKTNKKYYKYEITSIKATKNKATVYVKLTYYDSSLCLYKALRSAVLTYLKTKKTNLSANYLISLLNKDLKKNHPIIQDSVKLKLIKVKGKWKIEKMPYGLWESIDCDIMSTMDYYTKHPTSLIF